MLLSSQHWLAVPISTVLVYSFCFAVLYALLCHSLNELLMLALLACTFPVVRAWVPVTTVGEQKAVTTQSSK
jgi:hypothetical protein